MRVTVFMSVVIVVAIAVLRVCLFMVVLAFGRYLSSSCLSRNELDLPVVMPAIRPINFLIALRVQAIRHRMACEIANMIVTNAHIGLVKQYLLQGRKGPYLSS